MSDCTCGLGFTPATIKKRTKWVKDLQIELEETGLPGTATWVTGGDFRPTTPDKGALIMVLLPNGRVVHPTSPAHYEYADKHKK